MPWDTSVSKKKLKHVCACYLCSPLTSTRKAEVRCHRFHVGLENIAVMVENDSLPTAVIAKS